jgi:hypothetical protein
MELLPTARVEVLNVAFPLAKAVVPKTVTPCLNVTVPVGVPPNIGVTVAVNVTDLPEGAGSRDEVSLVIVVDVIEKLPDSVPSTLPALSVLWKLIVLAPIEVTAKGPV